MDITTFKRVEEKYLISKNEKDTLLKRLNNHITKDKYYKSSIYNIYYDTKDSDLIRNSIDKPVFKDKFRLRSYKIPKIEDEIFLEMKTKYKGVVGKRRVKIKLQELKNGLDNIKPTTQILKEITYYIKFYNLHPMIYIAYDRESFIGVENKDLRITFDTNLRSRREDLSLKDTKKNKTYIKNDTYIMEIKTNSSMPLWLVKVLSEMQIFPTSYSKYGKIYEQELKEMINYA